MLRLGFDQVEETAFGAQLVKTEYERLVKEHHGVKNEELRILTLQVYKLNIIKRIWCNIEEATDINIFFGRAVNEAHKGLDIEFAAKLDAIRQLEDDLIAIGKNVKLSMC